MFNIGPMELLVILLLALVVVGPSKLPEVGRSIGRALREFRKAQDEVRQTLTFDLGDDREPPRRAVRSSAKPSTQPPPPSSEEVAADRGPGSGDAPGDRDRTPDRPAAPPDREDREDRPPERPTPAPAPEGGE